jgi:hypothetical protein
MPKNSETIRCHLGRKLIGRPQPGFAVSRIWDIVDGHILATIWPQLQLTPVNYRDVFTQLEAILPI